MFHNSKEDETKVLLKTGDSQQLTPLQKDVMLNQAALCYGEFLSALGFDWRNDSHMRDTPLRVAKAWIEDLAKGCYESAPKVSDFDNTEAYTGMVIQKGIDIVSLCAHHNLPFKGKCTIAYLPSSPEKGGKVIGLSKLNRIAKFFAQRPTVQELLTVQIHNFVNAHVENNRGVAVVIESEHCCVSCRGVRDDSTMTTSQLSGYFFTNEVGTRIEFFHLLNR